MSVRSDHKKILCLYLTTRQQLVYPSSTNWCHNNTPWLTFHLRFCSVSVSSRPCSLWRFHHSQWTPNLRALTGPSRITQSKRDMMEIVCDGEITSVPKEAALVLLKKISNCFTTGLTCVGSEEYQLGDVCTGFGTCCGQSKGVRLWFSCSLGHLFVARIFLISFFAPSSLIQEAYCDGIGVLQLFEFLCRHPPWEPIPNWEPKGASSLSLMLQETFSFISSSKIGGGERQFFEFLCSHTTWEPIPTGELKRAQPLSHISFCYQCWNRQKRAGSYYRPPDDITSTYCKYSTISGLWTDWCENHIASSWDRPKIETLII